MLYECDAGELTWFRLESVGEAAIESQAMEHAVERYFKSAHDEAVRAYVPPASMPAIEQNIGLKAHILKSMPRFLTLRNNEGTALVTAMLPPIEGDEDDSTIIVGHGNSDPYVDYADAIEALARHTGLTLDRRHCYPYLSRR